MEKVFENIFKRLEFKKYKNPIYDYEYRKNEILSEAIEIVKQEAERCDGDRIHNNKQMERYLCRGKRTDNGEWVEGFYFCMTHPDGRHTHHFIIPLGADLSLGTPIEKIQVEIDPSTIC